MLDKPLQEYCCHLNSILCHDFSYQVINKGMVQPLLCPLGPAHFNKNDNKCVLETVTLKLTEHFFVEVHLEMRSHTGRDYEVQREKYFTGASPPSQL